ncbi:MAG: hypothetical protein QM758_06990 [Armatimonas sp.]
MMVPYGVIMIIAMYRAYYNFADKYREDPKWPLFICRYEDVDAVRKNPARTPAIVSAATLDGTVYRFDYKKMHTPTQGGMKDEIYR